MTEIITATLLTAWRNFIRNLHRYRALLLALVLISMVLTSVLGVVMGMRESLYDKAGRYFSGNIVALGYNGGIGSRIEDPEQIENAFNALKREGIEIKTLSRRSTYYEGDSIELFFAGYWTRQRRLVGVEWGLERPVLDGFDFVEGGLPEAGEEDKVLISTAAARELHISSGDELLISIESRRGRTNTIELEVAGIYAESSFFGYTAYLHRRALNRLKERPVDQVDEIGAYLENPTRDQGKAAKLLGEKIEEDYPSFGVLHTREDYRLASGADYETRHYGVVTVGAQLEEINDLLAAVTIIAGAILLMFLGITAVGVSNTFTMIVWERTREIGTLRALGMQRSRAVASFLMEAAMLGLTGAVPGLFLGIGVLEGTRLWLQFPYNFATTLFFTQGRLFWQLSLSAGLLIVILVAGASVLGSLRSALKAGKMHPAEALSTQK
ncbi:MAG: ABC transporter permease [Spirochaetaceae bacterium]